MTNNGMKAKNETQKNYGKRTSPQKDKTRKPKVSLVEKKPTNLYSESTVDNTANTTPPISYRDDELLTPETILKTYESVKTNPSSTKTNPSSKYKPSSKENIGGEKSNQNVVNILDLLGQRDNLEKIAKSVNKAVEQNAAIDVSSKLKTPPITPNKKSLNSDRFAGLSNSPAPNNLPLPSFSFLDQALSNGANDEAFSLNTTLPSSFLKPASEPTNLLPLLQIPTTVSTVNYDPLVHLPGNDPFTRIPKETYPQQNDKLYSVGYPAQSSSVPITVQPPTRALNHSPPSNPHLDELSSQLRMMLNILPTKS